VRREEEMVFMIMINLVATIPIGISLLPATLRTL